VQKARKHLKDFPEIEIPSEDHLCPGCAQGKMTNRPFYASTRRATRPFELIHSDLKSFPVESYHRFKYVIVFFDDYTSHAWTVNMRTKDAALTATSHFLAMVETKFGSRVTQWMSDAGGEYKSKAFNKMLLDRGIEILQSIPYAHQQNGRAERIIRTLMEKAESMRFLACLPQSWWQFSVEHAVHVYNRTPLRRLNWQTPFQLLWGERPSIDHLRVFGCGAYVFIPAETRANKLAPKSELMTYLGNAPGADGFVFMRGPNNTLYYATQCIFDESMFPKCPKPAKTPSTRLHQENAPPQHYHADDPPVDEEDAPKERVPKTNPPRVDKGHEGTHPQNEGSETHRPTAERETSPALPFAGDSPFSDVTPPRQETPPTPPRHEQTLQPTTRRSKRSKKVPRREGNVYGETRHPVEILQGKEKEHQQNVR